MQRVRSLIVAVAAVVVLSCSAGCGPPLGPYYQPVAPVPNAALVYIYRPGGFFGAAISYEVNLGPRPVVSLPNGGYLPFYAPPGPATFWAKTEARSHVEMVLEAGKIYFLKGTMGMGVFVGRPQLEQVPPQVGEAEIAGCRLIMGHAPAQ